MDYSYRMKKACMIFWRIIQADFRDKRMNDMRRNVAVIGAGASGMMAAIAAAGLGARVTIYEHGKPGKKILATGNGKCNLSNLHMTTNDFFSHYMPLVENCLDVFSVQDSIAFFEELGLCLKEKNGYLYPLSEQAVVVVKVLLCRMEQLGIRILCDESVVEVTALTKTRPGEHVMVKTASGKAVYDAVILACGSKAAPKTGSDGSGYDLAVKLGHKLIPVLPSLVQLRCSDSFCKSLAGIRTDAEIHMYADGNLLCQESGELQLTDYGISGIPVFQLSGTVNRYLYQHKKANIVAEINFFPQMNDKEYQLFVKKRKKYMQNVKTVEEFFTGILNQKLMLLLIKLAGLTPERSIAKADKQKIQQVFALCRNLQMHIKESNGFENAQVCTGGVDLREVTPQLESVFAKRVFFAGELLDVDGRCGGYNLQWAWTSGWIAGCAAAGTERQDDVNVTY